MKGFLVMCLVSAVVMLNILLGMSVLSRTWEYRAVYHYDCQSYQTES